jgi:hypothetical protein
LGRRLHALDLAAVEETHVLGVRAVMTLPIGHCVMIIGGPTLARL